MSPSKKPPSKKLSPGAKLLTEKSSTEQFKYVAALLEQVQGQVKAVAESLDLTRNELNQKIDDVEKRLSQEIYYTQLAVKGVKEDTVRIEGKLDRIVEKVEQHDEEIVFLKTAVAK